MVPSSRSTRTEIPESTQHAAKTRLRCDRAGTEASFEGEKGALRRMVRVGVGVDREFE